MNKHYKKNMFGKQYLEYFDCPITYSYEECNLCNLTYVIPIITTNLYNQDIGWEC